MKKHIALLTWIFISLSCLSGHLQGDEILVNTQDGETFILDISPEESIGDLQNKIAALSNGKNSDLVIEMPSRGSLKFFGLKMSRAPGGYLGYPRNYLKDVSSEEKSDIRFIVTTLADKSWIEIGIAHDTIEDAGWRIDHLHPLRFLMAIFTDEELKVGIRNIRARGWIWHRFTNNLKNCLAVEKGLGNMKNEYIFNFSHIVKIDPNVITPAITQESWDDFIDLLITHIPRSGNHDRYDT